MADTPDTRPLTLEDVSVKTLRRMAQTANDDADRLERQAADRRHRAAIYTDIADRKERDTR